MTGSPPGGQPFSLRLRHLLDTRKRPDGKRITIDEMSAATGLSVSYLKYLLSGQRDNPTRNAIQLLADFFSVDPNYFFDVPEDPDLERITLLARNLPAGQSRAHLRAIVEQVVAIEKDTRGGSGGA